MIARVGTQDPNKLVRVYSTGSIMDGYLVKGRLEVEGITVLIEGGEGPYRFGPVDLYVSQEEEPRAKEILAAATVTEDPEDEPASPNGDAPSG
jgi:hypothetical protein